jgi:ABC-type proline/glycine betaine transport system ATPase subunit
METKPTLETFKKIFTEDIKEQLKAIEKSESKEELMLRLRLSLITNKINLEILGKEL